MDKQVVNIAVIQDKRILLVRGEGKWNLPGGRLGEEESHLETLAKHLQRELPETEFKIGNLYRKFSSEAPNAKREVTHYVYFGEMINGLIHPTNRVVQAKLVSDINPKTFSYLTKEVISSLRRDYHL